MEHDIFFDCPLCNHTIKASSDLVGVPVACPDCGNEFKVPEILDGRNPRLRSQMSPPAVESDPRLRGVLMDLEHLEGSMNSLLRRQRQQIQQLDFLEENCTLVFKQLNLLERPGPVNPACITSEINNAIAASDEVLNPVWERWSLVCGVLTLLASLTVAVLLILSP